jgi:hypothetical protein
MCETSKMHALDRHQLEESIRESLYWMGISQPAKGTILPAGALPLSACCLAACTLLVAIQADCASHAHLATCVCALVAFFVVLDWSGNDLNYDDIRQHGWPDCEQRCM